MSSPEETKKCFDMGTKMINSVEGEKRQYLFGAIAMVAIYLFDTHFETMEEKLTAIDEFAESIKSNMK